MTWTVRVHDAAKQLKAIPRDRRQRILDDIVVLAEDPFQGLVKPLKGRNTKASTAKPRAAIASSSDQSTRRYGGSARSPAAQRGDVQVRN